ncbi:hypothetical protein A6U98_03225 [Rhizobium sp. WYCCWR10014]|uniref:hypothetical protein n=1 Tax=Rhizobium sp. WYCCWR10014 TaxID=1825933 RepID=UPI0007E3C04B|nr:hypothetical protein [Rhizobium sp. WYCCWR10014]OAV54484.1 hypothetical protein A6U98_03225 [Rhizobium sp. WYCCWR10014]
MSENQAISAAKAFAIERGLRFEEPISAQHLDDGRYRVTLAVEGASDPNAVIDPPEFIVHVDLEQNEVRLMPAM